MKKSTDKTIKKLTSRMQASLLLVFCIITLLMVGLMARLVYIVQIDGDRYTKKVLSRQTYVSSVLPYKRGEILDAKGTVLAQSVLRYRLVLDPKLLLQNEDSIKPTFDLLTKSFQLDIHDLNSVLKKKPESQYVIIKKNLDYDKVKAFTKIASEDKEILGAYFEEEYVRVYPYKTLACDVLGFSSADNTGFYGIEEYYNKELNGTNGRTYKYFDSELDIEHIVNSPVTGNSVVTSINADVQRIIQEKINEFNKEIGSKQVKILVMNPNNGDIIAMASGSEYDLNDPRDLKEFFTPQQLDTMSEKEKNDALYEIWKNDVIADNFEPGSTFKPITVATALEENLVTDNSTFNCDGYEIKDGEPMKCAHIHGNETLAQTIINSCNDAMMQIAVLEGKNLFYQYEANFGIGKRTGIDLPGEEQGLIVALKDLGESGLAASSFGQSTSVPMIQIAAAFSSIVNGGYYYQPHVMKEIISDSGATIKEYDKVLMRQTVSKHTSELLQKYLYQTVEVGTATGAKVTGYSIGGKTGTAQKFPRIAEKYVVSFIGCVPAINPKMVLFVAIDEPNVEKPSSRLATAFSGELLKEILPVLGIYPDGEIDYLLPTITPKPPKNEDQQNNQDNITKNGQTSNTEKEEEENATEQNAKEQNVNGDSTEDNNSDNGAETSGDENVSKENTPEGIPQDNLDPNDIYNIDPID